MSDSKVDRDSRKADVELITRFFDRVGATLKCPICASTNWGIVGDRNTQPVIITSTREGLYPAGIGGAYPVISLFCNQCGYISQHIRSIVDGTMDTGLNKPVVADET